jgi:hypothetical protein
MIQNLLFLYVELLIKQFEDLGLLLLMSLAKGSQGGFWGCDRRICRILIFCNKKLPWSIGMQY